MRLFTIIVAVFLGAGIAAAQGEEPGPSIGSAIPHSLETVDAKGQPQSFKSVVGEKGAVLVFFRSADWCPYCRRQLIDLNKIAGGVSAKGYNLVGISYDSPEKLAKFSDRRSITFPLLSDEGSKIIDAFGIRNPTYPEGHYAYGVPHPTVLVVDANGVVTHKFFSDDYKVRAESDVILDAVTAN